MWCSVVSALVNVVLDWFFVFPFGWGVFGAALASTLAVAIGGIIVGVYLFRRARTLRFYPLKASRKSLRFTLRNIGYQCRIGASAMLGEATMSVLMFTGNLVFMHYLGDDGVGAFGIACYYAPFVFMIGNAVAQSAQPIVSFNFGAARLDRVAAVQRVALATAVFAAGRSRWLSWGVRSCWSGCFCRWRRRRPGSPSRVSALRRRIRLLRRQPRRHRLLPKSRTGASGNVFSLFCADACFLCRVSCCCPGGSGSRVLVVSGFWGGAARAPPGALGGGGGGGGEFLLGGA